MLIMIVIIERSKKSKHDICIGKSKSKIIIDKKIKLIFQYSFKLAININYLGLFVIKQLDINN